MEAAVPKVRYGRRERQPPGQGNLENAVFAVAMAWGRSSAKASRMVAREPGREWTSRSMVFRSAASVCGPAPARRSMVGVFAQGDVAATVEAVLDAPAPADESDQVSGAGAGAGQAGHGIRDLAGPLDAADPGAPGQPGRGATSRDGAISARCSARKDRALAFLASVIPVLTDYRHDAPERRQRPVASRTPGKFVDRSVPSP